MKKRKTKLYIIPEKKKEEDKIHISIKDVIEHSENKTHLDALIRFPHLIVEDKRFKKEKYPKKYLEEI